MLVTIPPTQRVASSLGFATADEVMLFYAPDNLDFNPSNTNTLQVWLSTPNDIEFVRVENLFDISLMNMGGDMKPANPSSEKTTEKLGWKVRGVKKTKLISLEEVLSRLLIA